ncbi:MAG: hypothetical protein JW955_05350 [Sedimentisphaerales bacterium]|nr:hypothetical protein [Sedimentisphaerales bacterium]
MADELIPRKHRSDLPPLQISREEWDNTRKQLAKAMQAEERVEGIVAISMFDSYLEQLLRSVMIDDGIVTKLMSDGQALQSFSIKRRLVYALGLIPKPVEKDLDSLNKIRNAFAHEVDVTSFDTAPVRNLCENLSTAKRMDGRPRRPEFAHHLAVVNNMFFLESEIARRMEEKKSRQSRPGETVESRYAAYRVEYAKVEKRLDDEVAP